MAANEYPLERISGLYLKEVSLKGRGLFCNQQIKSGTIIEVCPTMVFNEVDAQSIDPTKIYDYYFSAAFLPDDKTGLFNIHDKEKSGLIAFGVLSLCNHSDDPNAKVEKQVTGPSVVFTLKALKDIQPDQEISIAYSKVWFDAVL